MRTTGSTEEAGGLFDIGICAGKLGRTERFVRRLVEGNRISFVKVASLSCSTPKRSTTGWGCPPELPTVAWINEPPKEDDATTQ